MNLKSPQRSRLESVVLIVIFATMFLFMLDNFVLAKRVSRERQLIGQLEILRNGLALYASIEHKKPESLVELASGSFTLPGERKSIGYVDLATIAVTDKGDLLDPFLNPYWYDKERFWVASTTRGFQNW